MRILFVHQNFPGQYVHIVQRLAQMGDHQLVALGINALDSSRPLPDSLQFFRYPLERGNTEGIHPLVMETETKIIRAEGCARAAEQLKAKGFTPDLICAHPGWGEALFLKAIWPDSPLLCYQEFFYNAHGFDSNFDPEFDRDWTWREQARLNMKNAYLHLTLEQADWNVSPTHFQASSFPEHWQRRISVIHDGVDTQRAAPLANPEPLTLPDGTVLEKGQQIVTFVNRRLEPYRGCHTFLRAIPDLQRQSPEARIVIVGETKGVSYGAVCPDGEWKDQFLAQIEGHNIHDVLVVVSRYYGGTKLGVGGLIRAYGGTAGKALDQVEVRRVLQTESLQITFAYDLTKAVEAVLRDHKLTPAETEFQANVHMVLQVPVEHLETLREDLVHQTAGKIQFPT